MVESAAGAIWLVALAALAFETLVLAAAVLVARLKLRPSQAALTLLGTAPAVMGIALLAPRLVVPGATVAVVNALAALLAGSVLPALILRWLGAGSRARLPHFAAALFAGNFILLLVFWWLASALSNIH